MVDFMENPNYRGMISDDLGVPPILGNPPIWAWFIAPIYVEIGDGLLLFYYIYIYYTHILHGAGMFTYITG